MMFARLSRGLRSRAALAAAALYAFCVLMPHAAVALGSAGHCLTDDHPAAHIHKAKADVTPHMHTDGTVHLQGGKAAAHDDATEPHKHSKADDKGGNGNCCGLFCISAIAGDAGPTLLVPMSFAADLPAAVNALTGRDPGRLHRPPIR
jgi:hypothetical protein